MHDRGKTVAAVYTLSKPATLSDVLVKRAISTTFPVIYLQQEAEVHGAVAGGAGARGGRATRSAAAQQDPGAGVAPAPAG